MIVEVYTLTEVVQKSVNHCIYDMVCPLTISASEFIGVFGTEEKAIGVIPAQISSEEEFYEQKFTNQAYECREDVKTYKFVSEKDDITIFINVKRWKLDIPGEEG
ncbi:MAG: hypothetical protein Q4E22_06515 [Coriobacteriia bacterium]|nr:hypothetical protein [Coriobacteriia bacterium]